MEFYMNKTVRNVIYVLIIVVCVVSIFIGVYAQFFKKATENDIEYHIPGENETTNVITQAEVKDAFKDLFTNEFFSFDYDETELKKIDDSKPIVYSGIDGFEKEEEGKYDIKATIPVINISSEVADKYNTTTTNIFVNKLNSVMTEENTIYTICDVNYTAYINNDILSVAIMASMKEGDSAQRLIVQTYNYNLKLNKDVTINDILEARGLDSSNVTKKIKSIVNKAAADAKGMQSTGYNVYERDIDSDMYDVSSVNNFIQGPNGELYIIYAYGNQAFTSEMDIIEI